MTRQIFTYPNEVLRQKAKNIERVTREIRDLAKDMQETMYANKGIGLAAPQVGESCKLITLDVGEEDGSNLFTLVNPEISEKQGSVETEEACLSLPEYKGKVQRAEKVVVTGWDLEEEDREIQADGLLAICLQHEIDHLYGIILLDYASRLKRNMYEKKIEKCGKNKN